MADPSIECVVMFADVAGSTAMYERMGDVKARERIAKALNKSIAISEQHQGNFVKTIGDEILVYFTDVDQALLAAQTIHETIESERSSEGMALSIRIGMHYGPLIKEEDDIFGDTVNVAARVVAMTKARQILCTDVMVERITSAALAYKARPYDRIEFKGKGHSLDVYVFVWEGEANVTRMAATSAFTNPARVGQDGTLSLQYAGGTVELSLNSSGIDLGRDEACDLVIAEDVVSRRHARIGVRRGKFVLSDQSTNGTYLRMEDGRSMFLRQEEATLFGDGAISLGKPVDLARDNILFFCKTG